MKQWRYVCRTVGLLRGEPAVVLQVLGDVTRIENLGRGGVSVETTREWRDARPEDLPFGSFERAGWSA